MGPYTSWALTGGRPWEEGATSKHFQVRWLLLAEGSSQENGATVSCNQLTCKTATGWVHQPEEEAGGKGNKASTTMPSTSQQCPVPYCSVNSSGSSQALEKIKHTTNYSVNHFLLHFFPSLSQFKMSTPSISLSYFIFLFL